MADRSGARLIRRELACSLRPVDVLRHLRHEAHPFALIGTWADGGAVIGSEPVLTRSPPAELSEVIDAPFPFGHGSAGLGSAGLGSAGLGRPEHPAFVGGWVGYLGYGLARDMHALPQPPAGTRRLPLWWFGYYDHVLRLQASSGQWYFEALCAAGSEDKIERRHAELSSRLNTAPPAAAYGCGEFMVTPDRDAHIASVARAIELIKRGDMFQANITLRLEAEFSGDPLDFFCVSYRQLQPPFAAFIRLPDGAIASLSPELFIRRRGGMVTTSPIKGTCHRSDDVGQARQERESLTKSAKNRAENVMIVDLMRNDFSRVCRPGTVIVPKLVRPEPHPGVWHLVSDVLGELVPGCTDGQLLRATFPPGSVTGAPKVRAMEVIHALEATPREVYTGAIGYRSPSAGLELNVAIRTFEFGDDLVWLGAGGGIVADSSAPDEFDECLLKASPLVAAAGGRFESPYGPAAHPSAALASLRPRPALGVFTSLRVSHGHAFELTAHLERLADSARTVFGKQLPAGAQAHVDARLADGSSGRLKITVRPVGGPLQWLVELVPGDDSDDLAPIALYPVVIDGGLGAHKWADRRLIGKLADARGSDRSGHLLIEDSDGSVLETERGNIFAMLDGTLCTPPADGRILPGIARTKVIGLARSAGIVVSIRPLTTTELLSASEAFVTNSVRGVLAVGSVAGHEPHWQAGPVTTTLAARLRAELTEPDVRPGSAEHSHSPGRTRSRLPAAGRRAKPVILVIDNYDSFTYNLAHLLLMNGSEVEVVSNDEVTPTEIAEFRAAGLLISPGPCGPNDAGVCVDAIRLLGGATPLLGVCLGHQAIAAAYGARIVHTAPVHGKATVVNHDGKGIFRGLPATFDATRYHSLLVDEASLPGCLYVTARTDNGLPMAIRHTSYPIAGVQFHPESILTPQGAKMIKNFVSAATISAATISASTISAATRGEQRCLPFV